MTEFYNCLIFLQFFTASFTIVLTPQGCARERIFSMKEQLYTIPLNDAVNAQDECPFCFIHRSIEQDLLDFVLGSGSSYMEADIREQTDKAGFCRYHFQKMFDYGNTLGNAWILKTHYQRMIREMQQEFASFRPGKSSLLPFAGVDPIAVQDIQSIVAKLKHKNIGILITDHNVYETLSICDRAYLLFEGKVLFQGTAEQLAENEIVREKYLGKDFVLRKKDF